MPKEILLHLEFTMCSSLLCLLTMPLQTWQDGWKAQQSGCSITIPSRLVYFARHGLNQPWTDATWCHLPWLAPAAVWLFMLKEPWACPDSPLHTFLGVFFLWLICRVAEAPRGRWLEHLELLKSSKTQTLRGASDVLCDSIWKSWGLPFALVLFPQRDSVASASFCKMSVMLVTDTYQPTVFMACTSQWWWC